MAIIVKSGGSSRDGNCNFCTRHNRMAGEYPITLIYSTDDRRTLAISICDDCKAELAKGLAK